MKLLLLLLPVGLFAQSILPPGTTSVRLLGIVRGYIVEVSLTSGLYAVHVANDPPTSVSIGVDQTSLLFTGAPKGPGPCTSGTFSADSKALYVCAPDPRGGYSWVKWICCSTRSW